MKPQDIRDLECDASVGNVRERAKAIFLTMRIVRHKEVALKCGVSIELIKQWHAEDDWLRLRAAFQAKNTGRLKELLGDPVAVAEKYAALCNLITEELQAQFERRTRGVMGAENTYRISKALAATYELHDRILRDAGVIKEKKTRKRRKAMRRSK